jgi:hypothetical protein
MLVDEQYSYVLSLFRKSSKCLLNLACFGLLVHDQEVPLRVWGVCDMTDTSKEQACHRTVCISADSRWQVSRDIRAASHVNVTE